MPLVLVLSIITVEVKLLLLITAAVSAKLIAIRALACFPSIKPVAPYQKERQVVYDGIVFVHGISFLAVALVDNLVTLSTEHLHSSISLTSIQRPVPLEISPDI